jgi:hypothetical protein
MTGSGGRVITTVARPAPTLTGTLGDHAEAFDALQPATARTRWNQTPVETERKDADVVVVCWRSATDPKAELVDRSTM